MTNHFHVQTSKDEVSRNGTTATTATTILSLESFVQCTNVNTASRGSEAIVTLPTPSHQSVISSLSRDQSPINSGPPVTFDFIPEVAPRQVQGNAMSHPGRNDTYAWQSTQQYSHRQHHHQLHQHQLQLQQHQHRQQAQQDRQGWYVYTNSVRQTITKTNKPGTTTTTTNNNNIIQAQGQRHKLGLGQQQPVQVVNHFHYHQSHAPNDDKENQGRNFSSSKGADRGNINAILKQASQKSGLSLMTTGEFTYTYAQQHMPLSKSGKIKNTKSHQVSSALVRPSRGSATFEGWTPDCLRIKTVHKPDPNRMSDDVFDTKTNIRKQRRVRTAGGAVSGAVVGALVLGPLGVLTGGATGGWMTKNICKHGEKREQRKFEKKNFQRHAFQSNIHHTATFC